MPPAADSTGELELAHRQLLAIEAFNRSRSQAVRAEEAVARSRETRMDSRSRLEILAREHEALIRRAHEQLRESGEVPARGARARAVVAHREERFTNQVVALLSEHDVRVVERVDNGADAIGLVVAEQPDLVFLEDGLLMVPGEDVVRQARRFCPGTRIAVQVRSGARASALLDAGADAVLSRSLPAAEMTSRLVSLVPHRG